LSSDHRATLEYLSTTTLTGSRESSPTNEREKFTGNIYEAIPGADGILLSKEANEERLAM
jgi:hypothetical protein